MRYNIFYDNQQLRDVVAKSLGYPIGQEYNWFTKDIFFQAYFYLTQRFSYGEKYDDYKDAGNWDFEVKDYTIRIRIDCSSVVFIVFGKKQLDGLINRSPYDVKKQREHTKKEKLIIPFYDEMTEKQTEILNNEIYPKFCAKNNIPEDISEKEFREKYLSDFWFKEVTNYNLSILGVKREDYEKYGEYSNAGTRHALRTLEQFLKNMLTPIYVRDVAYNIKGRMTDEDVEYYRRYEDNIDIQLKR